VAAARSTDGDPWTALPDAQKVNGPWAHRPRSRAGGAWLLAHGASQALAPALMNLRMVDSGVDSQAGQDRAGQDIDVVYILE
jgi:hypothetical protein